MKRKGLVWLVGLLVLMIGCSGCSTFFEERVLMAPLYGLYGKSSHSKTYKVLISSDSAKDVHVYLPFPHYKGKPDKKVFNWLKENFSRNVKDSIKTDKKECRKNKLYYEKFYKPLSESYRKIKLDLVDTEYGKMLYIYIPDFPEYEKPGFLGKKERVDSYGFGGGSREVRINEKRVVKDYKLTYEDSLKDVEKQVVYGSIEKKLNMPVYVQFEGEKLKIELSFDISVHGHAGGSSYFWYALGNPSEISELDDWQKESEEKCTFTKSGWHNVPIIKYSERRLEE